MNGIDTLLARPALPRPGANAGLLAHAASRTRTGEHSANALARRRDWRLTRLFSPEHGFFGNGAAGEIIDSARHPDLDLPIHSLYGEHRSPPPEWLKDLDLLVIDLQDLGVRCYTYASTLQNVLLVAADVGCPVMVLDRPTPLEGITDGPGLDPALRSFVGQIDLPLVYGLSQGPLALHLHRTDPRLKALELCVIPAENSPNPPWHPPSPGIPNRTAALVYPVTVWCEAVPQVSVDRGGPRSFHLWAMPDLNPGPVIDILSLEGLDATVTKSQENWPGILFTPNGEPYAPVRNAVRLLTALRDQLGTDRLFRHPDARPDFFDKLMGTASVRAALENGQTPEDIIALF
ncbi:MAG: DUF1343 domain-containing protein [Verrucomicrobia bacterium]|nr:DUF1343 domain-containing protein [Verrucomicrobiota bacterium]MCH8526107.1 DUF1343 domain-containing protein [Kiritimatiellia bacterium]